MGAVDCIDSYPFFVEPFHVDFTGRIFLGVLGNHMLNAAGNHSQRRGWGIGALNETRHTWVLSRLAIEINEMPRQYEHCEVRTWVKSVMRYFTNRNFSIHRADGTPLGYARSVWAMIDLETRQPCNLLTLYDGDILNYIVEEDQSLPLGGDWGFRVATKCGYGPHKGEQVPTCDGGRWKGAFCPIEGHTSFRFREPQLLRTIDTYYSDVDINGHINSIKYIEHILDLFPKERFEQQSIHRFEIAYKAESYLGDRLSFYEQVIDGNETDIEVRKTDGTVVCQAKVCFK